MSVNFYPSTRHHISEGIILQNIVKFLCFTYINYILHKRYEAYRRRHLYSFNELGCGGFVPVQTIQAHGGNGIMAPLILTSALDEGEWSKFTPRLLHFR